MEDVLLLQKYVSDLQIIFIYNSPLIYLGIH